jgi:hypothetical protein
MNTDEHRFLVMRMTYNVPREAEEPPGKSASALIGVHLWLEPGNCRTLTFDGGLET